MQKRKAKEAGQVTAEYLMIIFVIIGSLAASQLAGQEIWQSLLKAFQHNLLFHVQVLRLPW